MTKKAKGSIGKFIGIIVLMAVIGGGVFIALNFSSFAKRTAENIASETLGVKVKIGSLDINIKDKKVSVGNLTVANPSGFKKPHAITISSIEIAADQLSREKLVFNTIAVGGTDINLEVKESGTNLSAIQKNVKSKSKPADPDKEPIKVVVKDFKMTNANLTPSVTLINSDVAVISMPDISLKNIGERQNGIVAADAIAQILNAVIQESMKQSARAGLLGGLDTSILKSLDLPVGSIGNIKVEDAVNEGLKGLLGR